MKKLLSILALISLTANAETIQTSCPTIAQLSGHYGTLNPFQFKLTETFLMRGSISYYNNPTDPVPLNTLNIKNLQFDSVSIGGSTLVCWYYEVPVTQFKTIYLRLESTDFIVPPSTVTVATVGSNWKEKSCGSTSMPADPPVDPTTCAFTLSSP